MKHLILGSAGQIGYHLIKKLKEHGHEVITFDIVDTTYEDLRLHDNDILNDKMRDCDIVHFLAFDIGGSFYMKKYQNTFNFISNNIKIMNNVFDALKRHNKPFIFASSQMSNMQYSTYGILKAIGEKYTQSLHGIVVKFWNVYGYESDSKKFHVITDFIEMAKHDKVIHIKTDGTESRQFLYGDDCSECLIMLSENYHSVDRTEQLHITSFEWSTILDVAEIVKEKFPEVCILRSKNKDEIQKDKKNEPDLSILKYWTPKTSLRAGIHKIIDEHYK